MYVAIKMNVRITAHSITHQLLKIPNTFGRGYLIGLYNIVIPASMWLGQWGWGLSQSFASWLTAHHPSSPEHSPNFRSPRTEPPAHGQVDSQVGDKVFLSAVPPALQ